MNKTFKVSIILEIAEKALAILPKALVEEKKIP
jgi:hypothetical protein